MSFEGIPALADFDVAGKRVLVREDLNVPLGDDGITSDARIQAALPTLRDLMARGARTLVISHLGRPTEGEHDPSLSLAPVADRLSELLGARVALATDWIDGVDVEPGQVVLCENVRFLQGEKGNDPDLARRMAALCDLFVMDAFGTAHRAQASTAGVAEHAPQVCAGPLLLGELQALARALQKPRRPMLAIVGGSKVSGKLNVLEALVDRVDQLIVGGGIANTFIAAAGHPVGQSLYEPDLIPEARSLIAQARDRGADIPIPIDVVVAREFSPDAEATVKPVEAVEDDDMILDVGPETAAAYADIAGNAGTVVWNGPLGVFEYAAFADGTRALAEAIAGSDAFSIAGGGDTLAAIDQFGVTDGVSYISTGGGAFLEFLEGKTLPAVAALQRER